MNSQTARRPPNQRPTRPNKSKRYVKQTARFEGQRDGKALVFGWGGHLSHNQKVQLQRRVTWAIAIAFVALIIVVFVGSWINFNVIVPGLPITSVNGHPIPQSIYRKMVAFQAELAQNQLYGPNGLTVQRDNLRKQIAAQQKSASDTQKQIDTLNKQIKALPAGPGTQRTNLTNQLNTAQKQLTTEQATLTNLNQQYALLLIREWLSGQSRAVQARINPSASALNHAMNDFKANLPKSTSYNAFLSKDGVSDDDMQAMMTVQLRRQNMQAYLASLEVSPTYQVLARTMTIDTLAHAQNVLKQLKNGTNFGKLTKTNSVDANTNSKGGSLGWLTRGQYAQNYTAAVVENWLFDPARKLDELSPILNENGTYHIVQILGIDPSRPVDSTVLQTLKTNALSNWVLEQQALASTKITPTDQNKLLDPMNIPPGLPASAPSNSPAIPGATP
ncbi:MAG: hypothetical protein E6J44_07190 [Chloroflexi bacterium]|nr:MAG: hypothetical protein E6J44_07190 [Chloroflexota bacterium]